MAAVPEVQPPVSGAQEANERAYAQLHKTAKLVKADLPDLSKVGPPATEELSKILGRMLYWANASALGDLMLPFSSAQMGATTASALGLVGRKTWSLYFDSRAVEPTETCPMQLRNVIFTLLNFYTKSLQGLHTGEEQVASDLFEKASAKLLEERESMRSSPY